MNDLRKIAKTGFIIMMIGMIFSVFESLFFSIGKPDTFYQSIPNLICDIIGLMTVIIGCLLFGYAIGKKATIEIKEQLKKLKDL